MKVDIEYDKNLNIMHQKLYGSCAIKDLANIFADMTNLNPKPGLKIFLDITNANLKEASYNSISKLENELDGFIDRYLPVKKAIFVDSLLGFGIARMYEMLAEKDGFDVHVFKDREKALQWLSESAPSAS